VGELLALVGFAFVTSVTPGPNNVLLWASGAEFGFRRTVRHLLGTALGIGSMALAVAAGIGALVMTLPELGFALKVGGSIYLLYLAFRIARAHAVDRADAARPLGVVQAALFQVVNPKAWVFAIGAITTFQPEGVPQAIGSVLVALTMMVVVIPSSAVWAAGGGALNGILAGRRTSRAVGAVLAALLAASIAYVWL
jgi:threonine/homoserine/homoserine lactone efflux protein